MPGGEAEHACQRCGMTFVGNSQGLANHRRRQPPCPGIMGIRARMLKRQKNTSSLLEHRHDSGTGPHSGSLRRTFHSSKRQKQEAELNPADANDFNSENDSPPHSPSSGDKSPDISATCHDHSTSGSSCDVQYPTEATLSKDQVKQEAFPTRDVCLANYHHFQLDLNKTCLTSAGLMLVCLPTLLACLRDTV